MEQTNKKLLSNYELLKNEYETQKSKVTNILNNQADSEASQLEMLKGINAAFNQNSQSIEKAESLIDKVNSEFTSINKDITTKLDSVNKYNEKVKSDLVNYSTEKSLLEKNAESKVNIMIN